MSHPYIIVPDRFINASGLKEYRFLIRRYSHYPINKISNTRGNEQKIPLSVYCFTVIYNKKFHLLVSKKKDEKLFESINLLKRVFLIGNRINKFLTLYKAYECIAAQPIIEAKAVRDGLSHPSSVLTNRKTKLILLQLFDDTSINLNEYKHLRTFYIWLGKLLMEVDKEIYNRIKNNLDRYTQIKSEEQLL